VAVKAIFTDMADEPEFVDLFIGEAKLVADLVHQHIAQVYGLWREGKIYYMVMEMVHGTSCADFIDEHLRSGKELPMRSSSGQGIRLVPLLTVFAALLLPPPASSAGGAVQASARVIETDAARLAADTAHPWRRGSSPSSRPPVAVQQQ